MRTAINVVLILSVAVAIGFGVRYLQPAADQLSRGGVTTAARAISQADGVLDSDDLEAATAVPPRGERMEGLVTEFSLTERSGETVTSKDLLGQPHVVSFFFSTCPSVCVMQNQKMQQLQTEFEGEPVRLVAITVDPETDTPERLREYAKRYKADADQWLFLTGDLLHIRRVSSEMYGMAADKQVHSERFILVDSEGNLKGYYSWKDERQFDKLKRDIREMLAESEGNA